MVFSDVRSFSDGFSVVFPMKISAPISRLVKTGPSAWPSAGLATAATIGRPAEQVGVLMVIL